MGSNQNNRKMLIVEDDFYISDLYKRSFENAGYHVEVVDDGKTALEKIRSQAYDLILLDVMLPKITGVELLVAIRAPTSLSKNIPVFIISNLGREKTMEQARVAGATGYFLKVKETPDSIVEKVEKYFAKQAQGGKAEQTSE